MRRGHRLQTCFNTTLDEPRPNAQPASPASCQVIQQKPPSALNFVHECIQPLRQWKVKVLIQPIGCFLLLGQAEPSRFVVSSFLLLIHLVTTLQKISGKIRRGCIVRHLYILQAHEEHDSVSMRANENACLPGQSWAVFRLTFNDRNVLAAVEAFVKRKYRTLGV